MSQQLDKIKTPSINGTEMALFKLNLSDKEIHEIPEEQTLNEIRSLDVSKNKLRDLSFVEKTPYLLELDISKNQISDGVENLEKLTFLSKLNLSANLFETIAGFPIIKKLTVLDLSQNHLSTASDIPSLPFLKELNLSRNSIKDLNLASMPCLQTLLINNNLLTSLSLPTLPSLRTLDVSYNSISEIQEFGEEDLPFVWKIDLRFNSIDTPEKMKALAKLPLLFDLRIEKNPLIKEDGSHVQPILVILPTLTELEGETINAKNKVKAELKVKGCISH